jgi:F-type H+-transporting ATPase subunit b
LPRGLAAAERGHQEKALGEQRALVLIKDAKVAAAEIVGQAQSGQPRSSKRRRTTRAPKAGRVIAAAQAEIDRETNRAREELRERVATLAVAAAEKILQKEIDIGVHKGIVDSFAKQL